jgi:hypothetical protein
MFVKTFSSLDLSGVQMSQVFPPKLMLALLLGVCAVLLATKFATIPVHLAVAAAVAAAYAIMAIADHKRLEQAGASEHLIGASTARHMGLVWLWGAGILLISYLALLPWWREWWHFFLVFAVIGIVSLFFAATLERDAERNPDDKTMLKLGRILTIAQLIGMIATIAGIAIDPDKQILSNARTDWAANIAFVFGAAGLLVISAYALWRQRQTGA